MFINENFDVNINVSALVEGVTYNKDEGRFLFNFSHNDDNEIIKLENVIYESDIFNKCYYFAYEFESNVDSNLRSLFVKSIKFPDDSISNKDKSIFIGNAVRSLDSKINLINYDTLVYPQSMSELTRDMIQYLSKFASPKYISFELIKELPSKIEFDYDRFCVDVLDSILPNGRARYTDAQKQDVIVKIKEMMYNVHRSDYFSIARNIRKTKYRPYIKNYYKFRNKDDCNS